MHEYALILVPAYSSSACSTKGSGPAECRGGKFLPETKAPCASKGAFVPETPAQRSIARASP
jgi:hypothetical protein